MVIAEATMFTMTLNRAFTGQIVRFDQDAYWELGIGASIASRAPEGHSEIFASQQVSDCPDVSTLDSKPACGRMPKILQRQLQYGVARTILFSSPDSHNPGGSMVCQ